MGILSDIGDFFTDNSSWVKPIVNFAGDAWGRYQQDKATDKYNQWLRDQEIQNYNDTVAYRDWYQQMQAAEGGGGGGGGGGGPDVGKLKQGLDEKLAAIERAKALYQPYHDTALALLPQMQQTYQTGLDTISLLIPYLTNPEAMERLTKMPSMKDIVVPLPNREKK